MTFNDIDNGQEEISSTVERQMKLLPEVIRIPFEEAVSDVKLESWEDEWFSSGIFDHERYGSLTKPKIDFVYNWVNRSETEFREIKHTFELSSPLNDPHGNLDQYVNGFINRIQLLVNSVQDTSDNTSENYRPQRPDWFKDDAETRKHVHILRQEDFFGEAKKQCLPTFNSISIESQIHNTPSDIDQLVALSDDMFLGTPHSTSDFYSPLFGSVMGFKTDHYNVKDIRKADVPTFGEKPYLYYTSLLLNHRFGECDCKTQAHFSHSISRCVMREDMASFPGPGIHGTWERFRGETDANGDGYLDWSERQAVLEAIKSGRHAVGGGDSSTPATTAAQRERMYYQLPKILKQAGLQTPQSNPNVLWTSLDGPKQSATSNATTSESTNASPNMSYPNPDFSATNIFSQLSRREPKCGDCLTKFLLSTTSHGLEPMLPVKEKPRERNTMIKVLVKYQHMIVDPDAKFMMIKDAEQAREEILERTIKRHRKVAQWRLNDDVMTEDGAAVVQVNSVMQTVFNTIFLRKARGEVKACLRDRCNKDKTLKTQGRVLAQRLVENWSALDDHVRRYRIL
ncbi:hypothetical protein H2198_004782 [Neophaeococcomyces mojaviensis]|uniref:Uncharacterized protein n=1 Tax=Neophaeococcomyces mojaviensis TaxID=3383035 RepID=A0ACC3A7L0_9EURO|nr:hypothetical protein H2198_004782 [Knufia sp. JES_112]